MKVGFIGLGMMGGNQAECLADGAFDLAVYDVFAQAMQRFAGRARLAVSPADAARGADVVGICVRDDAQVRSVLTDPNGAFQGASRGAIILIHSTVNPATVMELAADASQRGIALVDAPVSRTVALGKAGPFVYTMAGGDPDVFARARPVLDAYSTDVIHAGPLGAGSALKIANNLVSWVSIVAAAQAFRLAKAGGVEPAKLRAVMKRNGNLTPTSGGYSDRMFGDLPLDVEQFISQAGIGEKDLALASAFGRFVGEETPIATAAAPYVRDAMTRR